MLRAGPVVEAAPPRPGLDRGRAASGTGSDWSAEKNRAMKLDNLDQAFEALERPRPAAEANRTLPALRLHPAQVLQGKWVFVPRFDFQPTAAVTHREETPLRRCRKLGFVAEYECRVTPAEAQGPHR